MRDYDHRQLVRSKIPEEVVLAILGDFKGERAEEVIGKIVKNLQRAADSPAKLQKYARQLAILARLRNLVKETIKIVNTMPIEYDITQDYLYLEGKQEQKQEIIINLLKVGKLSVEEIAMVAQVDVDFVKQIQEKMSKR
ncbi:MAG: hypothetical protein HC880_00040 [Bacteroidia bacterium]|nr:hypothetical protein [Bacteroidia bacterium]